MTPLSRPNWAIISIKSNSEGHLLTLKILGKKHSIKTATYAKGSSEAGIVSDNCGSSGQTSQRPWENGGEPPKGSLLLSSFTIPDFCDTSNFPKGMTAFKNSWISLPGKNHPCSSHFCKKLSFQFFIFSHITSLVSSFSQSKNK